MSEVVLMGFMPFFLQSASSTPPTTPSYSQSLELENRMLDGSSMVLAAPAPVGVAPLHTTVISGPSIAECRHPVCPTAAELQLPSVSIKTSTASSKAKRGRIEDPCQIAPLKKRKIQVLYAEGTSVAISY